MGQTAKFAKSESPGHGALDLIHLYDTHLIYRFEDVVGSAER